MKKIFFLFISFTSLQYACKNQTETTSITGKWELVSITPITTDIQKGDALADAALLFLNISIEGTIWQFENNTITIAKNDSVVSTLPYKLSNDTMEVSSNGDIQKFKIETSANDLTLDSDEEKLKVVFKRK